MKMGPFGCSSVGVSKPQRGRSFYRAPNHRAREARSHLKNRIRAATKILAKFSTTYTSDVSYLAELAQGLTGLPGVFFVLGVTEFTHGPSIDEPLILHTEEPATKEIKSDYYLADGSMSIMELARKDGTNEGEFAYNSFGKIVGSSGIALDQPYSFTGREFEREIDAYYFRARYYDPSIGRFYQQDEVQKENFNESVINKYLYVSNTPTNRIDPSGRSGVGSLVDVLVSSAIVGLISAAISYAVTRNLKTAAVSGAEAFAIGLVFSGVIYGVRILGAAANSARLAKNLLRVKQGVDIVLEDGKSAQILIKGNEIVGFSTTPILHTTLAEELGYNALEVSGATIGKYGSVIKVVSSTSVPGASAEVLAQIQVLFR